MNKERLRTLFLLYTQHKISEKEKEEFWQLIADYSNTAFLQELTDSFILQKEESARISQEDAADILQAIFHAAKKPGDLSSFAARPDISTEPVEIFYTREDVQPAEIYGNKNQSTQAVHLFKTRWFRYAAAIILVIVSAFYLLNMREVAPIITESITIPLKNDVPPGGNNAILTLADGRQIVLDSLSNGPLTVENGTVVLKKSDGQLEYQRNTGESLESSQNPVNNTLSTPNGGQYQLRLPDGTMVWLNAASSITYPTKFPGNIREVAIKGEAYFEVARDVNKPFHVSVNNMNVLVLGTHFNINAYDDEASIKTTLLEGSIKVSSLSQVLLLNPGQQAQCSNQSIKTIKDFDLEQVTAWKKGVFNFNRLPLKDAMRQLARWYDLRIEYKDNLPTINLYGEIGRDLTLNQLLKLLSGLGVQFTIKDQKRLVVSPG